MVMLASTALSFPNEVLDTLGEKINTEETDLLVATKK